MSLTTQERNIKLIMAIISWTMIAAITYFVIEPLFGVFQNPKYVRDTAIFTVIFCAYVRYIFMLSTTFLSHLQKVKIVMIFLSIPIIFYTIQSMNDFESFYGDDGMSSFDGFFVANVSFEKQQEVMHYLKDVIFFFGVGTVIASIALSIRLLKSYWRVFNKTGLV